jgi:hypothetical protein
VNCKKCGKAVEQSETIEGFCGTCILSMGAGLKKLSKQDLRNLKEAVLEETAGLMSMETLKSVLEEMYDAMSTGAIAFDDAIEQTALRIQRLAGLGMGREMLKFTEALGALAVSQEEEIRQKMRRLTDLGNKP